jgi:hypothetical protein
MPRKVVKKVVPEPKKDLVTINRDVLKEMVREILKEL